MKNLEEISKLIHKLKTDEEVCAFLTEILTNAEISTLSKRWHILKMLSEGYPQRTIAKELTVSLCKVTRGAKVLKDKNSIIAKEMIKENKQ